MTQYVQYDEDGNIVATVDSLGSPPVCERQLAFTEPVAVAGKKIDLEELELIDDSPAPSPAPAPSPDPEE